MENLGLDGADETTEGVLKLSILSRCVTVVCAVGWCNSAYVRLCRRFDFPTFSEAACTKFTDFSGTWKPVCTAGFSPSGPGTNNCIHVTAAMMKMYIVRGGGGGAQSMGAGERWCNESGKWRRYTEKMWSSYIENRNNGAHKMMSHQAKTSVCNVVRRKKLFV